MLGSMIDNARAVLLNAALTITPPPSQFRLSEGEVRRLAAEVWPVMQRQGRSLADISTERDFQDEAVRSARAGDFRLYDIPVVLDEHAGSATRGAQYRGDQLAGVDNSQQPARGEPRCGGQSGVNQAGDTHYLGNGRPSKLRARLRYTEHGSYWELTHGVSHPALSVAFSLDQLLWAAGVRARQSLRQGGALQYAGPRQILTNGGW